LWYFVRKALRKNSGRLATYRGVIELASIQQSAGKWLHVALIQDLTDTGDRPVADHCWTIFPYDLYLKFHKGDRIEFRAYARQYVRSDGTCDYGLEANGEVCKIEAATFEV